MMTGDGGTGCAIPLNTEVVLILRTTSTAEKL